MRVNPPAEKPVRSPLRPAFAHIRTICSEFLVLVAAMTLMSGTAGFYLFRGYGQPVMTTAALFAFAVPLVTALPYVVYLAVRLNSLMSDNAGLQRAALTDRLTGLLNRAGFEGEIRRHIATLERKQQGGLMLLVVDADNFKQINDRLGHPTGDQALKAIAAELRHSIRTGDALGRIGGEEFAISLPCANIGQGRTVAERLRLAINALSVGDGDDTIRLSVSVGGAFSAAPQSFDVIYAAADHNLYQAKQAGRNRSTISAMGNAHGYLRDARKPVPATA